MPTGWHVAASLALISPIAWVSLNVTRTEESNILAEFIRILISTHKQWLPSPFGDWRMVWLVLGDLKCQKQGVQVRMPRSREMPIVCSVVLDCFVDCLQ